MALSPSTGFVKPEVWAAAVQAEFTGRSVMRQFATDDNTLVGNPGETINFTSFDALSVPSDAVEGTAVTPQALTSTDDGNVTIKEVAKAVEITDRARLTALGDPMSEASRQVGIVIARKIDADLIAAAEAATLTVTEANVLDFDTVRAALLKFGDRIAELTDLTLVVHSKVFNDMLGDSAMRDISRFGNPAGISLPGFAGMFGAIKVVVSDTMTVDTAATPDDYNALLINGKPLQYVHKREPLVEQDRDILARSTVISTNVHYAVRLAKASDIVLINTQ